MMPEYLRLKIITEHYKKWAETTKNETHRSYAKSMYEACVNNNYKEAYKRFYSAASIYQDVITRKVYWSLNEAAEAKGLSLGSLKSNYANYNLRKIRM